MVKGISSMLAKAIQHHLNEHHELKLSLGIPGIACVFIKPDGTTEEVSHVALLNNYKNRQDQGKKRRA